MARSSEQIEALLDRLEGFFGDYDKADDEFKRGQWHDHFAEKLGPYEDKLKALNGPDFDVYKESYDEFNKDYSDIGEDEYIAALTANIDKMLDKLRSALGEEKVELESGPKGTEIVSHEDKGIEANAEGDTAEVDMTSDENAKKRSTGPWKNPSESGGRDGHSGLPGTYKPKGVIRSDEDCKVDPANGIETNGEIKSDEECKEGAEGVVEKMVESTPSPVDDAAAAVLTEKSSTDPTEEKDEYKEFMDSIKKYSK